MICCSDGIYKIKSKGKLPVFITFDIETTCVEDEGEPLTYMYIWQACVGNDVERYTYYGRTWEEFKRFMRNVYHIYGGEAKRLVCYVFNLGYEFQFIRSVIPVYDMFATQKRVPVRFNSDLYEWRCAYKLTNMSLRKFLESEGVSHKKLEYDYKKVRYSDTPMSTEELEYCEHDVLGLHEGLCSLMLRNGNNLNTIPMTSTGYVRREARKHTLSAYRNKLKVTDLRLDEHLYILCKAASRGGNTHANYLHSNTILKNVHSFDIVSSYPWVMLVSDKFPISPWARTDGDIDDGASHLLVLSLYDVKLRSGVYFPYISASKCEVCTSSVLDNGRVVRADHLLMVCTEIDYKIILNQYSATIEVIEHYRAQRGQLPLEFRQYVYEMFKGKCELKGVDDYLYGKYKNKFNALFGMMLTDITRSEITYLSDDWGEEIQPIQDLLKKYYNSRSSFLSYQWGIYVTAIARERLQQALDMVGRDGAYCDTDSVKYIGSHSDVFEAINKEIHKLNLANDIVPIVEVNGKSYELGLFEADEFYDEFITMGAKKYAYKVKGKYGVTVSGLNKKNGAKYLEEHGGLKAFREGTIFDDTYSGRLSAHYDDKVRYEKRNINGHIQEITSNVSLLDTSYTLGLSQAYTYFLKNFENYVDND